MRITPSSTVALLLLLLQLWMGLGHGRAICIPLGPCVEHAAVEVHHSHDHSCAGRQGHDHDHGHGPAAQFGHDHDECGCHIHVPMPSDERLPSRSGGCVDLQVQIVSAVVGLLDWSGPAAQRAEPMGRPPDRACLAQARGLKATRLLL
jgi:ABC-type nickel/cobalt efflux system permease component RcnA